MLITDRERTEVDSLLRYLERDVRNGHKDISWTTCALHAQNEQNYKT